AGPGSEAACGSEGKYYQLTHDHLVPSLRKWLNRKQNETCRGRGELWLAERCALWNIRHAWRQLPSFWEWVTILLYTERKCWTKPQRRMMRTATELHIYFLGILTLSWIIFPLTFIFLWLSMK